VAFAIIIKRCRLRKSIKILLNEPGDFQNRMFPVSGKKTIRIFSLKYLEILQTFFFLSIVINHIFNRGILESFSAEKMA